MVVAGTERPAIPCRSDRPRRCRDACLRTPTGLNARVELCLGKKLAGELQGLIGPAQLLDLAFQILRQSGPTGGEAFTYPSFDLCSLDSVQQCLRHAADLGRNGFYGSPQRWIFSAVLLHQTYSALSHFEKELTGLAHGFNIVVMEASEKCGGVHLN